MVPDRRIAVPRKRALFFRARTESTNDTGPDVRVLQTMRTIMILPRPGMRRAYSLQPTHRQYTSQQGFGRHHELCERAQPIILDPT